MGKVVSTRGEPRNQIQKEVMAKAATEEKKVIVTERLMSPIRWDPFQTKSQMNLCPVP